MEEIQNPLQVSSEWPPLWDPSQTSPRVGYSLSLSLFHCLKSPLWSLLDMNTLRTTPMSSCVCVSVCVHTRALACMCAHLCICSLFPTIQWWSESILSLSSVTPTTVLLEACKSVYFLVQSGIDITLHFSFRVEMNVNRYKKKIPAFWILSYLSYVNPLQYFCL